MLLLLLVNSIVLPLDDGRVSKAGGGLDKVIVLKWIHEKTNKQISKR